MTQPTDKRLVTEDSLTSGPAFDIIRETFALPVANSIVVLGHSITTGDVGIYNSTWNTEANVAAEAYNFFVWANVALGGRLRLLRNSGVSGERTDQILARMDTQVYGLAERPRFVSVLALRNDLDQNVPIATALGYLQQIYDRILAEGSTLVACTELPSLNDATDSEKAITAQANRWIRNYAATHRGVILVDWARAWADPSDGTPLSAYRLAGDNTHPNIVGAQVMGAAFAEALAPYVGGSRNLVVSNADPQSVGRNPCMVGTAGAVGSGVTGTVADGWTVQFSGAAGVAAASKVARPGQTDEWQQIDITTAPGSHTRFDYTGYATSKGTLWTPGDGLYVECEFEIDDPSTITRFQVSSFIAGVSVNAYATGHPSASATFAANAAMPASGVIRTPVVKTPAASTAVGCGIQIGGTGVVRIGRMAIKKAFADMLPAA